MPPSRAVAVSEVQSEAEQVVVIHVPVMIHIRRTLGAVRRPVGLDEFDKIQAVPITVAPRALAI